jgi:hypothetical protein
MKSLLMRTVFVGVVVVLPSCTNAGDAVSSDADDSEYVFVADTLPRVGLLRAGLVHVGHLEKSGEFKRDRNIAPLDPTVAASSTEFAIINKPRSPDEEVYEYRAAYVPGDFGRQPEELAEYRQTGIMPPNTPWVEVLVKGQLNEQGDFVPEIGSTVILFQDYRFSKKAPRVYNLPGRFEKTQ